MPVDVVADIVGLGRVLRARGVAATTDRVAAAAAALAVLDAGRLDSAYWAGRLTLCASPEDVAVYDEVFSTFLAGGPTDRDPEEPVPAPVRALTLVRLAEPGATRGRPGSDDMIAASALEALRRRDLADLGVDELAVVRRLLATVGLTGERRRTRRTGPANRGQVDPARTLRRILDAGGEPVPPGHRRRRHRPRRIVLLVDVSGSMTAYADALLRFAHATRRAAGPRTEVFTVGTRLTRVTRALDPRDPDAAMANVAAAVPDWSGGTRLGELVKGFLDLWGRRGMARGAIVVVLSDGWERGDARLLGQQMAQLQRLAHRVVWANPRAGRPGFAPLAAGMAAALPHVDDFVAGHSLRALEDLARIVMGQRGARLARARAAAHA